jgi:hypothetical protein
MVRKLYRLNEAYNLVGRWLYGDDWNGWEISARPAPSPDDLSRARAPYQEALEKVQAEIAEIDAQLERTLSASEIRELLERRNAAVKRLEQAGHDLNSHPEPTESHRWAYETYQRGLVAEKTLIAAIMRKAITVVNGHNTPIDNLYWNGHPHFRYYIELSFVRMPRSSGMRRREPAYIEEHEFDSWLLTLVPLTESAMKLLSPKDRCRLFLRQQVDAGPQMKPKKAYLLEARGEDKIPGLTEVDFNDVWRNDVPEKWKQGGRRHWPEESPDQSLKPSGD